MIYFVLPDVFVTFSNAREIMEMALHVSGQWCMTVMWVAYIEKDDFVTTSCCWLRSFTHAVVVELTYLGGQTVLHQVEVIIVHWIHISHTVVTQLSSLLESCSCIKLSFSVFSPWVLSDGFRLLFLICIGIDKYSLCICKNFKYLTGQSIPSALLWKHYLFLG